MDGLDFKELLHSCSKALGSRLPLGVDLVCKAFGHQNSVYAVDHFFYKGRVASVY
jgi:hypothetical protein